MKKCCHCLVLKPLGEFYHDASTPDGKTRNCKKCKRSSNKKWYERNREAALEITREWIARNPERRKQIARASYERNYDKVLEKAKQTYAANADKLKAASRDRYRENREAHLLWAKVNRKRARINGGEVTVQEWLDLCGFYGEVCLCCREPKRLTLDHVIPLSKGGLHEISNIQPLCAPCNAHKGTKSTDYRVGFIRPQVGVELHPLLEIRAQ